MDTNATAVDTQVLLALHRMMHDGQTGRLTFHFNRGMVQKIERTEYQQIVQTVKR